MSNRFAKTFRAVPEHIDELGHVNNAVWLQWVQDIATAHWTAVADAEAIERYVWVVTRHEIDYRGNVMLGETVAAETWIPNPPRGAQFERCVKFRDASGKRLVAVKSTWAMLEKASGRLVRVPTNIAEPFLP